MKFGLDTELEGQVASAFAQLYAQRGNIKQAMEWYDRFKASDKKLMALETETDLYVGLINMCIQKDQTEVGQSIIRDILTISPPKNIWDVVFVWAAFEGKGVDEIARMMDVMEKHNQTIRDVRDHRIVTIGSINKLVEYAVSRNDPYLAERFIQLGKSRRITPNAHTLILQMDYRVSVKDIDGALAAYKHLLSFDLSEDKDVPSVNKLICAMCASGRHDFESIMNVAADLSDRRAPFSPETVSTLSLLHLSRGEFQDVVDLIKTHAFHFADADRAQVRGTLINYCLQDSTDSADAWDTYKILRDNFDEMDRGERESLMRSFFERGHADIAVHVFDKMRYHSRLEAQATVDTYIECFRGIALTRDADALEVTHNQLKVDYHIEPNTKLQNALIRAYTACQNPRRAIAIWDDITASREGPDLNSIHLTLRACETAPWGDQKARAIWERLQKTGLEVDENLWASFAAALVANSEVTACVTEIEEAQAKGLVIISPFM